MTKQRAAYLVSLSALCVLLLAWWLLGRVYERHLLATQRQQTAYQLQGYGIALSTSLKQRATLLESLEAFVHSENLQGDPAADFDRFILLLQSSVPGVHRLALIPQEAKSSSVSASPPAARWSEDLAQHSITEEFPGLMEGLQRALTTRGIVLQGPRPNAAGEQELIMLHAIYRKEHLWGLALIALDFRVLMAEAGLAASGPLELSLRDGSGKVIYGSSQVFGKDPEIYPVKLTESPWDLAAIPRGGQKAAIQRPLNIGKSASLIVLLLLAVLIHFFFNRQRTLQQAILQRTQEIEAINRQLQNQLTQRQSDKEKLESERTRLEIIFSKVPVALILLENDGEIIQANDEFQRLFGYSQEEVQGGYLDQLIVPPGYEEEARSLTNRGLAGKIISVETVRRHKDGTLVDVAILGGPIERESSQVALVGIYVDITRRKKAELELRKLSQAVEQSPAVVMITDWEGSIEYVNPRFTEITGYTFEEVKGRNPGFLRSGQTPAELHRKLWEVIKSGGEWRGEFLNRKKDGQTYWETARIRPIKTEDGAITHFLKVAEDITERKHLEDQLLQSQKMEAIGRLAGGIAHDFNNLLTVITGYADLILEGLGAQDPLRNDVVEIAEAGHRASSLTEKLLAFSRRQMLKPSVLDLNKLVGSMEGMLRRLIGEDVELSIKLSPDLWRIKADAGSIEQVIMNLVINSRDAMPAGGRLVLETGNKTLDEAYTKKHMGVKPGRYVMLGIQDTGIGMDEKTVAKIFDPFFTTKGFEKGTGLGLSIVYGIIEQSEGHIQVESQLGKGTVFRIYLPPIRDRGEEEGGRYRQVTAHRGSGTILLVEDEERVRLFTKTVLEKYGYRVLTAAHGEEAMEIAARYPERINLLLTDIVMPKMSGKELAEQLKGRDPELEVLFVSGYAENVAGINFLQKPFSAPVLLQKIQELI